MAQAADTGEKAVYVSHGDSREGHPVGLSALAGAETIIRMQKPKLAICIYHSPGDMLNIPLYIKKLVPEYSIYIRHYTDMMLETVCYAVCNDD